MTSTQSYVIEAVIPSQQLPEALFLDTQDPYHYFRVDRSLLNDRIILGGEDHETGQASDAEARFAKLETFLKKLLPDAPYQIVRRWSGQLYETIDGIPYIGKTHTNKQWLIATGFAGNGMTFGVLSALIHRDLILGRENATTRLYRTRRFTGILHYMERGYNFVKEFVKGFFRNEEQDMRKIGHDEGAVVRINGEQVAVYKSKTGEVTKLSPLCTHLKCVVAWNPDGKTWDCPCHGSRFEKTGKVLNGPASKPLKRIE